MRAKLIVTAGPPLFEWIVASRWGADGEYLSIGWTFLPAASGDAPIDLTPRRALLAVKQERAAAWAPATFVLVSALPDRMTVAGDFVPAEGYVRLYGTGSRLRVRSKGRSLDPDLRPAWRIEATRANWIGAFVEALPCAEPNPPA